MSAHTVQEYNCDNCGKTLSDSHNSLNIVTSKSEKSNWSRLHVRIEHRHGFHNDPTTEDADLCQPCAIKLLTDALKRVTNGERASAGTEYVQQSGWDEEIS